MTPAFTSSNFNIGAKKVRIYSKELFGIVLISFSPFHTTKLKAIFTFQSKKIHLRKISSCFRTKAQQISQ